MTNKDKIQCDTDEIMKQYREAIERAQCLIKEADHWLKEADRLANLLEDDAEPVRMDKEYFLNKYRFSDLYNGYFSKAQLKLNPDELELQDNEGESSSEIRMTDGKCDYILRLIEEEDELYDLAAGTSIIAQLEGYFNQVEEGVQEIRPIIELILYFGDKAYNGPMSMSEMFGELDEDSAVFCQ